MKKRMAENINKTFGFTLAETLIAVLILLMVSSIVAAGIPSARNAYEKVVLSSNADVLLSTVMSTLRNELGTAMDVKKQVVSLGVTTTTGDESGDGETNGASATGEDDTEQPTVVGDSDTPTGGAAIPNVKENTSITYLNPTRGSSSRIYIEDSETKPEIMFQRYYSEVGLSAGYSPSPLISSTTATADMYVTYTSVSYTGGIVSFDDLSVKLGSRVLSSIDSFSIRVITP